MRMSLKTMLMSLLAAGALLPLSVRANDDPKSETKKEAGTPAEAPQPGPTPRVGVIKYRAVGGEGEGADRVFEIVVGEPDAEGAAPGVPVPVPPIPGVPPGAHVVPFPGARPHAGLVTTRAIAVRRFFLGLQLAPLPDVLKSQLKLENGVVVQAVIPESPAAKAGVEVHDIVLASGDKKFQQPEDLIACVEESKGKEVELQLLRGGKETKATIKPGDAPAAFNVPVSPPEAPQTARFFVRPGIVLKTPAAEHRIPHDMTIKVHKDGEAPAKIVVTHDGKTYETTADKLDVLPEPIRPHIERMLGSKEAGTLDLDVLVERQPGVRLEVESKNIDEALDKWLPGAQSLLKEASEHQEKGRLLEEALRRAMVFAQRNQADGVRVTQVAPAAPQVEAKLDEVLKKLEEVQARLKALEGTK